MRKETDKCVKMHCEGRLKNGNATLLLISETVNINQFLGLLEGSPSSSSIDRDEKGVLIHKFLDFSSTLLPFVRKWITTTTMLKEKTKRNETIGSGTNWMTESKEKI